MTRCPCCGGRHLPLMDRVRAALEMEPEAGVHRLMWLTGDQRPEMVATLARMVHLRRGRGTVRAPQTVQAVPAARSTRPDPGAPGSVQASRRDGGR